MTNPVVSLDFSGQVVLITGGATGLGYAMAEAFGRAGARIALNDQSPERAAAACARLTAAGLTCIPVPADVREAPAVDTMIAETIAGFAVPDVVIANAGLYPNTPFLELSEAEWNRVLDTNVTGAFLTCQRAARAMVAAGKRGVLITLSSGAANAAFHGWSHYCVSKAGVAMLTRSMALELGPHGIRVNAISPGYIDVPEGGEHLDPAYREGARTAIPLGRPGTPADIANAALLLASPLSDFVTGAVLGVDGGSGAGRSGIYPSGNPRST